MSDYLKKMDNGSIQLCCGGNNCPTVMKIDETTVEITDDFGNKIQVKPGQAKLISDAVKALNNEQSELLLG